MATKSINTENANVREDVYTVNEFTAVAASVFGASPDIVRAALCVAGITKTTKSEAINIVNEFRKREVK